MNRFALITYSDNRNLTTAFFMISVFVVNPICGLMATYILIATSSLSLERGYALTKFYCIALAVFLGAVNASKIPENDLVWYFRGFLDAGRYGLLEYISTFGINGQGRELAFPLFNYLIYSLIGPNTQYYILIFTVAYYGLINLSVYRLSKSLNLSPILIATAVFLFAMAPNIFSVSAVILRQNLAAALVIFIIVDYFVLHKKHYLLMVVAVLTHASSLFFLALCFMPGIRRKLSLNNAPFFVVLAIAILTYQHVAGALAGFFPSTNVIQYALSRASSGTNFELPPLGFVKILFNIVILSGMLFTIYIVNKKYKKHTGIVAIGNVILCTLLFIISNLSYVELSVRFNFYYLSFFPLIVVIILSGISHKVTTPIFVASQPLFFALFVYGLYTSMWTYAANIETVYWPLPFYFLD